MTMTQKYKSPLTKTDLREINDALDAILMARETLRRCSACDLPTGEAEETLNYLQGNLEAMKRVFFEASDVLPEA